MLDLAFVRANLELVEGKLRDRGQDPAALLGDFRALDQNRRERITEAEQLKARRNKLSEEVARLKKSGQDATAVMEETRALKSQIEELAAAPMRPIASCRRFSSMFRIFRWPMSRSASRSTITSRSSAGARFRSSILRRSRTGRSASSWAFSIWSAPRRFRERDLRSTGARAQSSSGR